MNPSSVKNHRGVPSGIAGRRLPDYVSTFSKPWVSGRATGREGFTASQLLEVGNSQTPLKPSTGLLPFSFARQANNTLLPLA